MQDWCFTPSCLDRFVNFWPEAVVHRLGDVGHWVVEDAPQRALQLVQEFLNNDSPAGNPPEESTPTSTPTSGSTMSTSH
jgi:hypothetical protein